MKRSELKRGTKPLKRASIKAGKSPMKKRRKRHRDTPESLRIREQYREQNSVCEISGVLIRIGILEERDGRAIEVHHLCGGAGRRDLVSNLVSVSPTAHAWVEANPIVGRIVCLYVKHLKGEVVPEEYLLCCGRNLSGWLANRRPQDSRILELWQFLVERL